VKVVLDASVVVAAVATKNPRSATRVLIEAANSGVFELVITDAIEVEYRDAVEREKVKRAAPRLDRLAFVDMLVGMAERVEVGEDVRVVAKDPKDDKYVTAAVTARAEFVVSFDRRHLVAIGEYENVRFVTPGDFLAALRSSTS
jgi:putative PIN family toxin of toxin-antitoxin system